MIKINVISNNIFWEKNLKNPQSYFNNKLKKINSKSNLFKKKIFICSLLLSDTKEIKKLNKKFRNKNKHTDVLSFPFHQKMKNAREVYLGDIIISFNYMNKPRGLNNYHFKKNVMKIFIHGFLHLLGFDHTKEKDYKKMFNQEQKILRSVQKFIN